MGIEVHGDEAVRDDWYLCEQCANKQWGYLASAGYNFCSNCGAAYELIRTYDAPELRRVKFGQMYLPPLEWIEIFRDGQDSGMRHETARRRNQSFWERLRVFIENK